MVGGYGGGIGILSLVMPLLWLVVLIGAVVLGYRWLSQSGVISSEPALEKLRRAYAGGEISIEEFEELRTFLSDEHKGI
jgi:putative membrane protein